MANTTTDERQQWQPIPAPLWQRDMKTPGEMRETSKLDQTQPAYRQDLIFSSQWKIAAEICQRLDRLIEQLDWIQEHRGGFGR